MLTISLLTVLQSSHTIAMNNWSGSDCLKGIALATACYGVVSVWRYYNCYNKAYASELDAGALKSKLKEIQQIAYSNQNHQVKEIDVATLNELNNLLKKVYEKKEILTKDERTLVKQYDILSLNNRNKIGIKNYLIKINEKYKNIHNQMNNKKELARSSENFMQSTWYHSFLFSSNMTPRELAKDNIKDWKIKDSNWWKKQSIVMQYE